MTAASAAEAKRAMISFDEFPKLVDSDGGPEFRGEFDTWLARKNIAHRVKDPKDLNSLATVDRKSRPSSLRSPVPSFAQRGTTGSSCCPPLWTA